MNSFWRRKLPRPHPLRSPGVGPAVSGGRTRCSTNAATQRFTFLTGDCGSSALECSGAAPPATLAEFTLNGANNLDFYDVSLVNGYNLLMLVTPSTAASGNCSLTGCVANLNGACPSELKVVDTSGAGDAVACRSTCEAFGDPMYSCSGAYRTSDTCKPSSYSELFKNVCPRAYSYAYDDGTSTFTYSSDGGEGRVLLVAGGEGLDGRGPPADADPGELIQSGARELLHHDGAG